MPPRDSSGGRSPWLPMTGMRRRRNRLPNDLVRLPGLDVDESFGRACFDGATSTQRHGEQVSVAKIRNSGKPGLQRLSAEGLYIHANGRSISRIC